MPRWCAVATHLNLSSWFPVEGYDRRQLLICIRCGPYLLTEWYYTATGGEVTDLENNCSVRCSSLIICIFMPSRPGTRKIWPNDVAFWPSVRPLGLHRSEVSQAWNSVDGYQLAHDHGFIYRGPPTGSAIFIARCRHLLIGACLSQYHFSRSAIFSSVKLHYYERRT